VTAELRLLLHGEGGLPPAGTKFLDMEDRAAEMGDALVRVFRGGCRFLIPLGFPERRCSASIRLRSAAASECLAIEDIEGTEKHVRIHAFSLVSVWQNFLVLDAKG